jgi:hypothetical protein
MATSPSGTDEDNIDRFASTNGLWSVITNKPGAAEVLRGGSPADASIYIRLDLFDPENTQNHASYRRHTIEGCKWFVVAARSISKEWLTESLAKVTKEAPTTVVVPKTQPTTYQGGHNTYKGNQRWNAETRKWDPLDQYTPAQQDFSKRGLKTGGKTDEPDLVKRVTEAMGEHAARTMKLVTAGWVSRSEAFRLCALPATEHDAELKKEETQFMFAQELTGGAAGYAN